MNRMEIGFLNACLKLDLEEEMLPWCQKNGFKAMEVGGIHGGFFQKDFADEIHAMFKKFDVKITALGTYDNYLDGDKKRRKSKLDTLKHTIDSASALKIPIVSTHVGCNNQMDYQGNLKLFKEEYIPIIKYARDQNVKIAIENCPGLGQFCFTHGNLMFTPRIMSELIHMAPDNFGMNFDPSHLYWQMVDMAIVVEELEGRIFHTHAKDTEILTENRKFDGIFGNSNYRFKIPGKGQIDWESYINALKDTGYTGILSIELEDADYEKTPDKVKEGLLLSRDFLKKYL
jgi:sugar phosphate isomerase/epimerase